MLYVVLLVMFWIGVFLAWFGAEEKLPYWRPIRNIRQVLHMIIFATGLAMIFIVMMVIAVQIVTAFM